MANQEGLDILNKLGVITDPVQQLLTDECIEVKFDAYHKSFGDIDHD